MAAEQNAVRQRLRCLSHRVAEESEKTWFLIMNPKKTKQNKTLFLKIGRISFFKNVREPIQVESIGGHHDPNHHVPNKYHHQ